MQSRNVMVEIALETKNITTYSNGIEVYMVGSIDRNELLKLWYTTVLLHRIIAWVTFD